MTLKGRYLLEMQETESASGAAQVLARRLAGDWQLQSAAKKRARGSGEDRWWSAVAGVLLVIVFVFYSLYWNIPALIALIALVGLLLWELFRTLSRRAMLKQAENAISPHRAAEALYRRALNLPVKGRDISRLYDVEQVDALSAELSGRIQGVAARHGIRVDTLSLRVDTVMGGLRKIDDTLSRIPLIVTITAGEAQGGCVEIILEYLAGFAFSDTGDCLLLDASPRVLAEVSRDVTLPEERPFAVEFLPCPHCGFFASERFLRAQEYRCPQCGGNVKQKE